MELTLTANDVKFSIVSTCTGKGNSRKVVRTCWRVFDQKRLANQCWFSKFNDSILPAQPKRSEIDWLILKEIKYFFPQVFREINNHMLLLFLTCMDKDKLSESKIESSPIMVTVKNSRSWFTFLFWTLNTVVDTRHAIWSHHFNFVCLHKRISICQNFVRIWW